MPWQKMFLHEMSVDKMSLQEMILDEMPVDEMSWHKVILDEMSVGEMSWNKMIGLLMKCHVLIIGEVYERLVSKARLERIELDGGSFVFASRVSMLSSFFISPQKY
jgi:hypothetical protein